MRENEHIGYKEVRKEFENKRPCLMCLYTNIDCYSNKKEELIHVMKSMKKMPNLVMITEVNPKHFGYAALQSEYNINGYEMLQSGFYEKNKRGIIAYIDEKLSFSEVNIKCRFQEFLCFKVMSEKLVTNCLIIYRSPNSNGENNEQLLILIGEFMRLRGQKIILGDFNMPQITWNIPSIPQYWQLIEGSWEARLLDVIRRCYLIQHVQEPTRARGINEPAILDLVLSDTEFIENLKVDAPIAKSDHGCIIMEVKISTTLKGLKKKFAYNRGDYDVIRQLVLNFVEENHINRERGENNLNMVWEGTKDCIMDAVNRFIPKTGVRKFKTFISTELKNLIRKKHSLWKIFTKTKTGESKSNYNKVRNEVTRKIRLNRKENQQRIAMQSKKNPKAFWNYVNCMRRTHESMSDLRKEINGKEIVIRDEKSKAEMLADFFSSVHVREKPFDPEELTIKAPIVLEEMTKLQIEASAVYKKLKNLNVAKSPGPDKLHPRVWYELGGVVSSYLADVYNRSLSEGKLPYDWKCGEVVGLYKKGSRMDVRNYRPVSLTCIACKVMESLIKDHLMNYFNRNNLFSSRQFGFLKKRSTILQLLRFMDELTESVDKGEEYHIIYTDVEKAFDRVPHKKLLHKLKMYRVEGDILNWIEEFLTGRKFRVRVNESLSDWHTVESGVPQGSILGPLLFIIYINDMMESENKEENILLFADDSKLYRNIASEGDCLMLQKSINRVSKWFDCWEMKVNAEKCSVLRINNRHKINYSYKINGNEIMDVNFARDLGVIFDTKLSFKQHVQKIVGRAYMNMGLIKRNFDLIDKKSFLCLYKSLVRSQVEYAAAVWSPYRVGLMEEVERIQRRATKIFKGCRNLRYEERLNLLGLTSLLQRRIRGDMIEVFKILKGFYEKECVPFLPMTDYERTRGNSLKLQKRSARKDVRKYSFSLRVVDVWNGLPESVVTSGTIDEFKRRIDDFWGPRRFVP